MRLDSPRALGLAGAALVLAGWLLGSTLSPPVASTQARPAPRPGAAADAPAVVVPLHDLTARVRRAPPPAPTRNPFAFGGTSRRGDHEPARDPAAAAVATAATGADAAAAEAWRLIGMATSADGTLTAVLGRSGTVVLARAGDVLPGGATVTAVRGEGVLLTGADGAALDLRLP